MTAGVPYDGKQLDVWLASKVPGDFPGNGDYAVRFKNIRDYLDKKVYPHVTTSALWAEVKAGRQGIYLTNHGAEHVQHVITKATELLGTSRHHIDHPFDPYYVFLLLTAILFHDLGNVFGREDHQKKCLQLMNQLGNLAFPDGAEKRVLGKIAAAHCGIVDGTKDVIGKLDPQFPFLGRDVPKRALAALLRLADELADDRTRASRFMLDNNLLDGSEAFHAYSYALRSAMVREGEISLHFELTRDLATRKVNRYNEKVYLLDEIYARTLKTHNERTYCMRYLRPYVSVDRIKVTIEVLDDLHPDTMATTIRTIGYYLQETGYPSEPPGGIHDLCPDLENGEKLHQNLNGRRV